MWISLFCALIVTQLIRVVEGITKQQPCCTGVFSRGIGSSNHWHKGLQEAVYHSLTQHSAFDGSLDDRVERDRRLYKRVQAAEFSPELSANIEKQTGLLVNADQVLEFQPSSYTCHESDCKKRIMAIWEMRKTDHPRGYYIIVKLPVSHTYIQDSYEYTSHDGLKHLGAENIHKQHIYHYTIGTDGKQSFKSDQRRAYKPMKFPGWSKQKSDYDINRKDFNNVYKKHDDSKEDFHEDEDRIIRIEPRRKFHFIDSSKPKKQGLVVAYIPENSQREFQIPDHKYDGFLPLIEALAKETNNYNSYRDTSREKDYDVRRLKVYEDVIKKYIDEQANRPKAPADFRPSRPYIQYSEPDPLYIQPNFGNPNGEQKPTVDENKFLIIHKYPDPQSSQLPVASVGGATPTVPYISVTVSNKIPVQNINHIDLSTTMKTTASQSPTTTPTPTSEPIMNTTSVDVELITISNNTVVTMTRQPPKSVVTNTLSTDVSREELTTSPVQPTTRVIIQSNNVDVSTEETSTFEPTQSRNIIKKDTNSKTNNVGSTDQKENDNGVSNRLDRSDKVTITLNNFTETTITTALPWEVTTTAEMLNQNTTVNFNTTNTTIEETTPKQTSTIMEEMLKPNSNTMNYDVNTTTENFERQTDEKSTTQQATTEYTLATTTVTPDTTTISNYYIEEARSQLADLFASITFDLFNSPSPSESEEDPINYSALLSAANQPETVDSTNYDDFLNEELAEPTNQNQQRLAGAPLITKESSRNTSKLLSSRQYTNSH